MPKSVPNPPFVNFGVLDKTDAFDNRRVRMVCSILTYDQRSAKVKTTDQEEVIVIFLEKLREDFRLIADYYLFEGAAKEQGALLFVEKEPEPLLYPRTFDGTEDEISKLFAAKKVKTVWSVMDDMTTFMHERPWLKSGGAISPDPRYVPVVKSALASSVVKEESVPDSSGSTTDEEMKLVVSE